MSAFQNQWFADYEEARQMRLQGGGYLLPYRHYFFIADREGRILEANDAFLRLVGYSREDLASGRVRWTELSPPEWRERDVLTHAVS